MSFGDFIGTVLAVALGILLAGFISVIFMLRVGIALV